MADGDPQEGGAATPPPATADVSKLQKQISDLTTQVETANGLVKSLQSEKADLEKNAGGYSSANTQLNQQLATLQADFDAAKKEAADASGQAINLQTQIDGLTGQVTDLTAANGDLAKQGKLFEVIVNNTELHPYISQFNELAKIVSPEADKDTIKDVFTKIAQVNTNQITGLTEAAVQGFQGGGTPPATPGAAKPGAPTAPGGDESTIEGVFQKMQSLDTAKDPGEYNRLMNRMYSLQHPAAPPVQPN